MEGSTTKRQGAGGFSAVTCPVSKHRLIGTIMPLTTINDSIEYKSKRMGLDCNCAVRLGRNSILDEWFFFFFANACIPPSQRISRMDAGIAKPSFTRSLYLMCLACIILLLLLFVVVRWQIVV